MKKKILTQVASTLLAVAIMASMITGCSKPENKTSSDEPKKTNSSATENKPMFTEQVTDMKGKHFKIGTFWINDWVANESSDVAVKEVDAALRSIEKDYNCTIEFVQFDATTINENISTTIAGGNRPADAMELAVGYAAPLIKSGYLAKLDDIKVLDFKNNAWLKTTIDYTNFNGHQYGTGWYGTQSKDPVRNCIIFNKTLADKYGIEDLYKAVKDGTWTYDKFLEVSKTVMEKSNKTVYGSTGINVAWFQGPIVFGNGAQIITQIGGKFKYAGNTENMTNALQFVRDYIREGYWWPGNGGDWVKENLLPFMNGKTLFYFTDYWVAHYNINPEMEDDFGVLPLPKGPNTDNYVNVTSDVRFFTYFDKNPDIEKVATIMVAIANRTAMKDWRSREIELTLRDEESLDMLEIIMNTQKVNYASMMPQLNDIVSSAISRVVAGEQTPKEAMSQVEEMANIAIDEFFTME